LKCPLEIQKKVDFFQGPVEKYEAIQDAEVIIVDPPRKGLDASVLQAILSAKKAEQVIYISCHPLSFFRDCTQLLEKGWRVTLAETYLLFPGSDHVELLCILEHC
jgi:23S rRNA (uracil1939-C5)-methyltransferase